MSENFKKEDLRVLKTQKALHDAIGTLLERRKFRQMTVHNLCEKALTSRAAFYTHYKDKYDLLNNWFLCQLAELKADGISAVIDNIVYGNTKRMQNILAGADDETNKIIINGLVGTLLEDCGGSMDGGHECSEYYVLLHFCAGGLFEIVKQQNEPQRRAGIASTKAYFYALFSTILSFHKNYKK